jgi:hypothetical protein
MLCGNAKSRDAVLCAVTALVAVLAACDSGTEPGPEPDGEEVVGQVDVLIDLAAAGRRPISPYIYGSNRDHDRASDRWTVRRLGGNRLTGYNWANNYSNAGSDWEHSSDRFLLDDAGIPAAEHAVPARVMTYFHEQSMAMGAESIITLQMAGHVASDDSGPVPVSETAPSPRWVRAEPRKDGPFTTAPDPSAEVVYMDELVHRLVEEYGGAAAPGGVRWDSRDNAPALWSETHPRIHPEPVGAAELVDRSVELAAAVKDVDPDARIVGPALYGINAYMSLQDAPDWTAVQGGYAWFIDYYLDRMRQAEAAAGRRLLDALDVHWYPEAQGDHRITEDAATTERDIEARLQAPRTLWDETYREDSWIADWLGDFLPILPRLRQSIEEYYPGTQLAIAEYDYGGGGTISGGLAQTDVLGAFGRHGVQIAALWGIGADDVITAAAFKLYRDYDGAGGTFGDTSVRASASDPAEVSVYASIHGEDASTVHVIVLNKNTRGALDLRFTIENAADSYSGAEVWSFGPEGPAITRRSEGTDIAGSTFTYTVPGLTASHLIVRR